MPINKDLRAPFFAKEFPKGPFYEDAIKISTELSYHADGNYPQELIESARPNEDQKYKDYRKSVFTPITTTYFDKVLNALGKIRRAEDWEIKYPKDLKGSTADGESLQDYCEENYPFFDSLENWFFTLGFKHLISDPNSVVAIYPLPKNDPNDDTEYLRPYTNIFPSCDVMVFIDNYFAAILLEEKSAVKVGGEIRMEGNIFMFFDKNNVETWEQVGEKDSYTFSLRGAPIVHEIGHLPVIRMGGKINKFKAGQILYDSFVSACLPFWREAIRRYSDHQVNMVLHLHPDRWEIEDTPCKTCNEKGSIMQMISGKEKPVQCPACKGQGTAPKTPWGTKIVKPVATTGLNGNIPIPTPPMGYVNRDIASIDFLKKEYKDNIKDGLSSLNMEFLMEVPITNSGVSKSYDMDGTFSYFNTVARHIVDNIFNVCFYFVNEYRYIKQIPNEKDRDHNLPDMAVPEKYDIISSALLAQRIATAKDGDFNPALKTSLQIDYAEKEFGKDSREAKIVRTIDQLDPIPNRDEDGKMVILANHGCTAEDYILSCMISSFVHRAISENEDFLNMEYSKQLEILKKYVADISKNLKEAQVTIVDPAGKPII